MFTPVLDKKNCSVKWSRFRFTHILCLLLKMFSKNFIKSELLFLGKIFSANGGKDCWIQFEKNINKVSYWFLATSERFSLFWQKWFLQALTNCFLSFLQTIYDVNLFLLLQCSNFNSLQTMLPKAILSAAYVNISFFKGRQLGGMESSRGAVEWWKSVLQCSSMFSRKNGKENLKVLTLKSSFVGLKRFKPYLR